MTTPGQTQKWTSGVKGEWQAGIAPLSTGQERIWLLDQLRPDNRAHSLVRAIRIRGVFSEALAAKIFGGIVERHEILRTTFVFANGTPLQRVNPAGRVILLSDDWSSLSAAAQEDSLKRLIQVEMLRPFDLERGPLFRTRLIIRNQQEAVLLFVAHHLIFDGWSMKVLAREILLRYASEQSGKPPPLDPLPLQYGDYARSQKIQLEHNRQRLLQYWKKKLKACPLFELPSPKTRPDRRSFQGALYRFRSTPELYRRLQDLAKRQGHTLFVVLLAAFKVLLFRYSRQEDIVLRCPAAGRNQSHLEPMLGFFVNTLILRTDLSDSPSFRNLLGRVAKVVREAFEHDELPFEEILKEAGPAVRDLSRPPLSQIAFVYDRDHAESINAFGIECEPLELDPGISSLDLSLFAWAGRELSFSLEYRTDLFDHHFVSSLADHFLCLLQAVVEEPGQLICHLQFISGREREQIAEWSRGTATALPDVCVQQLFEQLVRHTPHSPALVFEGEELSYRELNRRSNRLARRLQREGVGPEKVVGICLERSLELVISILGVLKAGAAYLPLDPVNTPGRIQSMIEDCRPGLILTDSKWTKLLPDCPEGVSVLQLDRIEGEISALNGRNPARRAQTDNLAYVLYTSGSTGLPTGVMIAHRALTNHMLWMQRDFPLDSSDAVLQKTPFGFDASVWEFFAPLLAGARLVLAPSGSEQPGALVELIQKSQITILQMVPTLLRLFLEQEGLRHCPSLRRVFSGGEVLSASLQRRFVSQSQARLCNLYGPTEACIDTTFHRCRPEQKDQNASLGRPIDNVQLHLLDRSRQIVPIGVPGEICIGGEGLARGYVNNDALTRSRFVPHPIEDGRLYRTGDLARYHRDGRLEFLGRLDEQLKINGIRVEPAEIENALETHPQVSRAIVTPDQSGTLNRLVAYFVKRGDSSPSMRDLRDFLLEKLPRHLVPAGFVELAELPVTASGKVDRCALPVPDWNELPERSPYVAPGNKVEAYLTQLWERILQVEKVGIHDNIFDLGAGSIQIIQIAAEAAGQGYSLAPELMFRHQTVSELARLISANGPVGAVKEGNGEGNSRSRELSSLAQNIPLDSLPKLQPAGPGSVIESLGVYLPPREVSTREIVEGCRRKIGLPLERLTGIKSRRMAGEDEFSIDLACKAVTECLERSSYHPSDIDLLISCNISRYDAPLRVSFEPGTAIRLKHIFGFDRALVFDVANACAGLFTGIWIADTMIRLGSVSRCLVVSGEYITHLTVTAQKEIETFLDNRLACLTLGDAGVALLLEKSRDGHTGFQSIELCTLGKYHSLCVAKSTTHPHGGAIMHTDMIEVSNTATRHSMIHSANALLRSGWAIDRIDHLIAHQTSRNALRGAAQEINRLLGREICHEGNLIDNLAARGNTATTSHFVAVKDRILEKRIRNEESALFSITGSGQTIGTALYRFDKFPERLTQFDSSGLKAPKVKRRPRKAIAFSPPFGRVRVACVGLAPEADSRRDAVSLARQAAEDCLGRWQRKRSQIQLMVYSGVYRDEFLCEPAVAAILAGELEINDRFESRHQPRTLAFDIFNGSLGFLNSCLVATQMIGGERCESALLLASEIENNASVAGRPLLGLKETGSAMILQRNHDGETGFGPFLFRDMPQHTEAFTSFATHQDGQTFLSFHKATCLHDLYLEFIPSVVEELLDEAGVDAGSIGVVLPPQVSSSFVLNLERQLSNIRAPFANVENSLDWASSSLPFAWRQAEELGLTSPGTIGLLIGIGSGIQVGCALYYF